MFKNILKFHYYYFPFRLFIKTVDFDGVWIDMNEVSNFETNTGKSFPETGRKALQCPDNKLEKPPYGTLAVYSTSNASPTLRYKALKLMCFSFLCIF